MALACSFGVLMDQFTCSVHEIAKRYTHMAHGEYVHSFINIERILGVWMIDLLSIRTYANGHTRMA